MDEVYLQAVLVKKTVPLALARLRAKPYLESYSKKKYFDRETHYEFRNLPKKWFRSTELKNINDEIQLVVGHLNAEIFGASDLASI